MKITEIIVSSLITVFVLQVQVSFALSLVAFLRSLNKPTEPSLRWIEEPGETDEEEAEKITKEARKIPTTYEELQEEFERIAN